MRNSFWTVQKKRSFLFQFLPCMHISHRLSKEDSASIKYYLEDFLSAFYHCKKTRQKKQDHRYHDLGELIFCRYANKIVHLNLHCLYSLGKDGKKKSCLPEVTALLQEKTCKGPFPGNCLQELQSNQLRLNSQYLKRWSENIVTEETQT